MRIGDVAKRSGLSSSSIRFYERHGLIRPAERDENGYRNYPTSVLETLNLIRQAQGLGFTLEEIRSRLPQGGGSSPAREDVLLALREKLTALDDHIEEVLRRRQRIVALIEKYQGLR